MAGAPNILDTFDAEEGIRADVFTDGTPGYYHVRVWDVDSGNTLPEGLRRCFKSRSDACAFARKSLSMAKVSDEALRARAPQSPAERVDALQDRVQTKPGQARAARSVKVRSGRSS